MVKNFEFSKVVIINVDRNHMLSLSVKVLCFIRLLASSKFSRKSLLKILEVISVQPSFFTYFLGQTRPALADFNYNIDRSNIVLLVATVILYIYI